MRCASCVRKHRLNKGQHKFTTVDCGISVNIAGEDVRWYLERSDDDCVDGVLWYINSCNRRDTRNCEIVNGGFDACGRPVVCVKTNRRIKNGEELFLDYYTKK